MQKIAITSFVDNAIYFADETNQMTLSGKELDDRFKFILFVHPEIVSKIKRRDNVIIYPYLCPNDTYYEAYKYAKSLEFVKSNEDILSEYDYIIKTDTDVFFTKNLNDYVFDEKICFNYGKYSGTNRCIEETYSLANLFGFNDYKRMFQVGATLFGTSKNIIEIMNRSDLLSKQVFYYLCEDGNYEATIPKTWGKSLYAGTSTMIATEIVVSSMFNKSDIKILENIDANCFSDKSLEGIYHIHQWHGHGLYSKFEARSGLYDNLKALGSDSISDYCLNIFLENKKENYV